MRNQNETFRFREGPSVTAGHLMDDNRSGEAESNRRSFSNRPRVIVRACSDARFISGPTDVKISQIATHGPKEPYTSLFNDPKTSLIVNSTHFDGTIFTPGQIPEGCGGLNARRSLEPSAPKEGLLRYISEIKSVDPVILSIAEAAKIARHAPDKVILATIQDHTTGKNNPLAFLINGGKVYVSAVPVDEIVQDVYDPKKLYANGIPSLRLEDLPIQAQNFLTAHDAFVGRLHYEFPDFETMQKNQNPEFVVITSEKMQASGRYPGIMGRSGSNFQIHIPRQRGGERIFVAGRSIQTAVEQAEYPISHFSNVGTILIETGSLESSRAIAAALLNQEWMQNWFIDKTHQLFIAESSKSITNTVIPLEIASH